MTVATVAGNAYEILGVDPGATLEEVRAAYRRLARDCHPDVAPGDVDAAGRFHVATLAWTILEDPERRAAHDLALAAGRAAVARPRWAELTEAQASARAAALCQALHAHDLVDAEELAALSERWATVPGPGLGAAAEALAIVLAAALSLDRPQERRVAACAAGTVLSAAAGWPEDADEVAIEAERAVGLLLRASRTASTARALVAGWAPVAALLPGWLRRDWWSRQVQAASRGRAW